MDRNLDFLETISLSTKEICKLGFALLFARYLYLVNVNEQYEANASWSSSMCHEITELSKDLFSHAMGGIVLAGCDALEDLKALSDEYYEKRGNLSLYYTFWIYKCLNTKYPVM